VRDDGWCLLDGADVRASLQAEAARHDAATGSLTALASDWDRLPPDLYLKDGGKYRFRRHASAIQALDGGGALQRVAHRPHWQPTTYNALHGGIRRWFEPIADGTWQHPALQALIGAFGRLFAAGERAGSAPARWFVEVHQFRIDASRETGKPTPEGAHRDGVDFVAIVLIARHEVAGGETAVFDAHGRKLAQVTLAQPFTALLLDDRRVVHETTPIVGTAPRAYRDTLVVTYRRDGFMDPQD
jgi:hypothetical protein